VHSCPLPIPRRDRFGQLLDLAKRSPVGGCQAARWQRVRRKRFLASIRSDDIRPWIARVVASAEGRRFESSLARWLENAQAPPLPSPLPDSFASGPGSRCSLVINTVDRARQLAETLADLKKNWTAEDELILVLGPCDDGSEEVIASCGLPHRLVRCTERNLSVSRNAGLVAASGEFVAYLDDDASPEAGWLDALISPLRDDSQAEVAAGFILDGSGHRHLDKWVVADELGRSHWCESAEEADAELARIGASRAFLRAVGCNMAFRRLTLLAHGGFDPAYRYFLEETDITRRICLAGGRCVVAPASRVRHRLGTNPVRSASVPLDDRLTVVRSLIHYLSRFGFARFAKEDIRNCVWQRVLLDLERIAWEIDSPAGTQIAYLGRLVQALD
jgi:GT2 family glycosyltransferase